MPMKSKRTKLSDQVRRAIDASGKSRYRICKEAAIGQPTLSRFMHGIAGLSIESLDRLADCLGLNITMDNRPHKQKGR
jgi:transcriptional regulator with XRE-family HTH domain